MKSESRTAEETADGAPGDFYLEAGFAVFTEAYHLRRGYCCGSGCRHCPYDQDDASVADGRPADL